MQKLQQPGGVEEKKDSEPTSCNSEQPTDIITEVSEDEDDALTVKQLMNRLVQARLPDSVTADNPSRFPKLFVDNLIVELIRTEQDLKESIERWYRRGTRSKIYRTGKCTPN